MTISNGAKAAAQELVDAFGMTPMINTFTPDTGGRPVDLAIFDDCPVEGVGSVGSVSLSDHDLGFEQGLRIEIVAVFPSTAANFPRAIGSSALAVINEGWPLRRGAVHPGIMPLYGLSDTLEHLVFVAPFSWAGRPQILTVEDRTIGWLQAVPISEAERAYAERNGAVALEELLAGQRIDVSDLNRDSVAERA